MKDNDIKAIAERYGITLIYLFGSQADKGRRYLEGEDVRLDAFSDLDVAVTFENPPTEAIKIYGVIYKEISEIFDPFNIDLIFMHEVGALFQYEIIKGVRVYEKDRHLTDEFEEGIMKRAEDLLFKKRIFDDEVMEAIEDGYIEFEYNPNP
ncbi:MAG: nucleotidyltransferase domain-containing protein [Nitrospirae bacterium]|nr:nucleotidyltransferase domain-containing protein [Nitrospirota bacterium]